MIEYLAAEKDSTKYKWQTRPTVYLCPSDIRPYSNYGQGGVSYGMNSLFGSEYNPFPAKREQVKVNRIKQPSQLTVGVETDYMSVTNPQTTVGLYTLNPTSYSFGIIRYHNDGSNFLFLDPHVAWEKEAKGYNEDPNRWCQW